MTGRIKGRKEREKSKNKSVDILPKTFKGFKYG